MRLLFFALLLISFSVGAQTCRVLDPELQGSYAGGCVNGLADGEGTARGTAEYRGGFRQGMKHGKGVKTWASGDRYEGEFIDDRRNGYGVYTWGRGRWQGERYEGGYSNDMRHGFGTYRRPTGDAYVGAWQNDVAIGSPTAMEVARKKFSEEAKAAVAKEGTRVCREMAVGADSWEWVRGVVVAVKDDEVGVRIDEPGKHGHFAKGQTAWDEPTAWVPCL
jgi:hypothetical protein